MPTVFCSYHHLFTFLQLGFHRVTLVVCLVNSSDHRTPLYFDPVQFRLRSRLHFCNLPINLLFLIWLNISSFLVCIIKSSLFLLLVSLQRDLGFFVGTLFCYKDYLRVCDYFNNMISMMATLKSFSLLPVLFICVTIPFFP